MAAGVIWHFQRETRPLICDCHVRSKPQLNTVCCRKGSEVACLLSSALVMTGVHSQWISR